MPLIFRRFRHKETGKVWEVPAGRYGNFLSYLKKLVNYVRYNIPKYYVVHLTLTLREAAPEIDFKHLHRVMQFIDNRLKRAGCDFKYVAVKEIQQERLKKYGEEAIHYHILCVYSKPYVFPHAEEIAKSWALGNVKITAPKLRMKVWKIANYIGKYIGKGYEYEALDVKKSFTASQIRQIYKLSSKRLAGVVKRFGLRMAETFRCTYRKVYETVENYCRDDHKACKEFNCSSLFNDCTKKRCFTLSQKLMMEFPSEWEYEGLCYEPF
jgi:hypothetical protein